MSFQCLWSISYWHLQCAAQVQVAPSASSTVLAAGHPKCRWKTRDSGSCWRPYRRPGGDWGKAWASRCWLTQIHPWIFHEGPQSLAPKLSTWNILELFWWRNSMKWLGGETWGQSLLAELPSAERSERQGIGQWETLRDPSHDPRSRAPKPHHRPQIESCLAWCSNCPKNECSVWSSLSSSHYIVWQNINSLTNWKSSTLWWTNIAMENGHL